MSMGTNYYLHMNCCDKCDRADVIQIGKQSGGWKFTFRGHDNPYKDEITSVSKWKELLTDSKNKIYDEYGQFYTFDDFWESISHEGRTDTPEERHRYGSRHVNEGYDFINTDFS